MVLLHLRSSLFVRRIPQRKKTDSVCWLHHVPCCSCCVSGLVVTKCAALRRVRCGSSVRPSVRRHRRPMRAISAPQISYGFLPAISPSSGRRREIRSARAVPFGALSVGSISFLPAASSPSSAQNAKLGARGCCGISRGAIKESFRGGAALQMTPSTSPSPGERVHVARCQIVSSCFLC